MFSQGKQRSEEEFKWRSFKFKLQSWSIRGSGKGTSSITHKHTCRSKSFNNIRYQNQIKINIQFIYYTYEYRKYLTKKSIVCYFTYYQLSKTIVTKHRQQQSGQHQKCYHGMVILRRLLYQRWRMQDKRFILHLWMLKNTKLPKDKDIFI